MDWLSKKNSDRIAVAVLGLVIALISAGLANGLLDADQRRGTVIVLGAIIAFVTAVEPLRRALAAKETRTIIAVHRQMLKILWDVHASTGDPAKRVPFDELAIHVWLPRLVLAWPVRQMRRAAHLRVRRPNEEIKDVRFPRGKGVVGMCWRDKQSRAKDTSSVSDYSKRKWDQMLIDDPDRVMNMTWEEHQISKHRAALFAAPVKVKGRVMAVISLDAPDSFGRLEAAGAKQILAAGAEEFEHMDLDELG